MYKEKRCPCCKETKSSSEYYKNSHNSGGLNSYCKVCCSNIYNKRRRDKRKLLGYIPPKRNLKRRHHPKCGAKIEEYDRLFEIQNGCCAICGNHISDFKKRFAFDHNHEIGKKRGLLCDNCNFGLGHFGDDLDILASATSYLLNYQ